MTEKMVKEKMTEQNNKEIIKQLKKLNRKFEFDVKVVERSSIKDTFISVTFMVAVVLIAYGISDQFEWHWAITTGVITLFFGIFIGMINMTDNSK